MNIFKIVTGLVSALYIVTIGMYKSWQFAVVLVLIIVVSMLIHKVVWHYASALILLVVYSGLLIMGSIALANATGLLVSVIAGLIYVYTMLIHNTD